MSYFVTYWCGDGARIVAYSSLEKVAQDFPPDGYKWLSAAEALDEELPYWGDERILVIEGYAVQLGRDAEQNQ